MRLFIQFLNKKVIFNPFDKKFLENIYLLPFKKLPTYLIGEI